MLSIFDYDFMVRAFIVGGLLSIILPCMGFIILLKRLSMIGDTLAHSSLAGVSIGLCFSFSPIVSSIIACIIAGLSIEALKEKLKGYKEVSTVIVLATSIGLAGIFSSFITNTNTISSYLFGSIVTISDSEFYLVIGISAFVIAIYTLLYNKLYLTAFDQQSAQILGINTNFINFMITLLSAITISISARTIGSLIVSSLLIIPAMCAMQFAKTYKQTLLLSIVLSFIFVYAGLFVSYFLDLKPGSVIVLISVVSLIFSILIKNKK